MTRDEYAGRLAEAAQELIVRVRDDDPAANLRWLTGTLTAQEQQDLLFVLAAAVPDDQPWSVLTAWTRAAPGRPQPCGTHAAAQRHRYHREPLCGPCRDAERARDRARKRVAYRASKTRSTQAAA